MARQVNEDQRQRNLDEQERARRAEGILPPSSVGDQLAPGSYDKLMEQFGKQAPRTVKSGGIPDALTLDKEDSETSRATTTGHTTNNSVEHPVHYNADPSGVECIEIVRHRNFNVGNAIKYLWRAGLKEDSEKLIRDKHVEDIEKAIWYLQDEVKRLRGS